MTTINIYENTKPNEESLILQNDMQKEFDEIKETLKELQKENKDLKKLLIELNLKILKKEVETDKKSEEKKPKINKEDKTDLKEIKKTEDKTVAPNKPNKTAETKKDFNKLRKEVLENIPIYTLEDAETYKHNVQEKYFKSNPTDRQNLIEKCYTIPRIMNETGLSRFEVKHYIIEKLIEENKIGFFRINKNGKKSLQVFYRINPKKTSKNSKTKQRRRSGGKFIIPDYVTTVYHNLKLLPSGEIQHTSKDKKREYILNYDIYDVLYIKSLSDSENFTMSDFNKIHQKNEKWNNMNLYNLINNIRKNPDLIKIIEHARSVLTQNMSFSKKGDLLKINDAITFIPVHQAKAWCDSYINGGKNRDVFIWELQKRFPEINRDYIAIILYNNANSELVDVLNDKKDFTFVENNPSKRRNLIMNGGLI